MGGVKGRNKKNKKKCNSTYLWNFANAKAIYTTPAFGGAEAAIFLTSIHTSTGQLSEIKRFASNT